MLEVLWHSIVLLFRGKLFQDPLHFARQALFGVLITAALCVVLVELGLTLGVAVLGSAVAGGIAQPFLFKNLKYT